MKNKKFESLRRSYKSCKVANMRIYESNATLLSDTSVLMEYCYPRVGNLFLLLSAPAVNMQNAAVEHYLNSLSQKDALHIDTCQVFTSEEASLEVVNIYAGFTSRPAESSPVRNVSAKKLPFNIQKMHKVLGCYEGPDQLDEVFERPATYVMQNNLQDSLPLPQPKVVVNWSSKAISIVVTLSNHLTVEDAVNVLLAALETYVTDKNWDAFLARHQNIGEPASWEALYQAELQCN